jgi:hypothetical protein
MASASVSECSHSHASYEQFVRLPSAGSGGVAKERVVWCVPGAWRRGTGESRFLRGEPQRTDAQQARLLGAADSERAVGKSRVVVRADVTDLASDYPLLPRHLHPSSICSRVDCLR